MPTKQKMLVLLDGSDRSRLTLDYIASVEPFQKASLVLFYVYSQIPECYWDLDNDPTRPNAVKGFEAWRKEKLEKIEAFMQEAKKRLVQAGFAERNLAINIHERQRGIARDILEESQKGYDAIILRRRGMGKIQGITLGSVSNKLLSRLPEAPILLAGKRAHNHNLIIAVDGSPSSVRAVDFVARQFGSYDYSVELFHVIRGVGTLNPTNPEFIPAEMFALIQEEVMRRLEELKQKLIAAGFSEEKVSGKVLNGAESRAEEIVREAEAGDCGTIIVGRKGVSRVQDFFMGRVCYKIIQSARDFTVWVI